MATSKSDHELLQQIADGSTGGGGGTSDATAANQSTGNASLASIDTKTPALGQALAAASTPIVLTAAQITTLTPPAAITGFATAANQTAAKVTTTPMQTRATFTITLASLATASARQSTLISNSSNYPAAMIFLQIKSGASGPTAGAVYELYLLRSDGTTADDAAGASDAAITIENAPCIGTIIVTNTANKVFYGVFDTAPWGPLGGSWGIAVKNSSGQTISTTEGDHIKGYQYYSPSQA